LDEKELCKHYVFMLTSDKYSHDIELNVNKSHKIFVPISCQSWMSKSSAHKAKKIFLKLSLSKSHTTIF
jgi:hypothetical protein